MAGGFAKMTFSNEGVHMDLVTVIVPIYNAEEYLMQCIESVINQTYKPIQVILVDDGSKDTSLSICMNYAKGYSNIEVYHQENRGVSVARNTALAHTKGKWVFFVDADDYVAPSFVENFMKMGEYPFIGGGYTENSASGWQYKVDHCVLSMEEYKADPCQNLTKIPSVHVIGNRYRYDVIRENQLVFDEGVTCGEDLRFNVKYFSCINELCASPHCDYFYTIRSNSASHTFWPNRLEEERTECQIREALLEETEAFNYVKYIHWHIAMEHYYMFSKKENEQSSIATKKLKEAVADPYFRQSIPWILSNGTRDMQVEAMCLKIGSYRLYKFVWKSITAILKFLKK